MSTKKTPLLHAKGFYQFASPWIAPKGVVYECLAIRSFEDIYKLGIDVYETYYKPVGLIDGETSNGSKFRFKQESDKDPNIITLKGSDGSTYYVPDTYITKIPDLSLIKYSRVVIATDLGALPDTLDLSSLKNDIEALVSARMNINAKANICKVGSVKNPTPEEHIMLERARIGNPSQVKPNTQMLLDEALKQNELLNKKNQALINVLIKNGLIDIISN